MKNVLLGYLIVLNHQETLKKLTEEERKIGQESIMGCLSKLMENLNGKS